MKESVCIVKMLTASESNAMKSNKGKKGKSEIAEVVFSMHMLWTQGLRQFKQRELLKF